MNRLLLFLMFYFTPLWAEYSIVFIHIGKEIPSYADIAISQARLFNPSARIMFVSSQEGLERFTSKQEELGLECYPYEYLPKSASHQEYDQNCITPSGFWRYTSERFLYLYDLMEAYGLENVFHLENDNMLYANLEPMLCLFQQHYLGVAATFDNDQRCIPGFVWISNANAMHFLADYFAKKAPEGLNDMQVIGQYRSENSSLRIDTLPIIMSDYTNLYPLESPHHHTTNNSQAYFNQIEAFNAIFDAAAIGQFLGGIDPIHANNAPGFINESALFNPSFLEYQWLSDEQGRLVPYAIFQNKFYKIINLHIHSKRLQAFKSQ